MNNEDRIIALLERDPGLTCEEIEARLGLLHQTVSARLTKMRKMGLVFWYGRRATVSGRSAHVTYENAGQGCLFVGDTCADS